MEVNPKNIFTVKVEDGKAGKDGHPAVGSVFRSVLAKDGFPQLEPDMKTSWDVFRVAADKYPNNRMLGWRPLKDGVPGPYLWKSYKEVYDEVLQVGSALQQLGVQPGSRIGIYGTNCPQWIVAMQACNGYSLICVPLYDTLGAGAVDYIIDHAEIDVVFIQDKKMKEILSPNCKSAKRLKALVAFTSATSEQIKEADQIGTKVYSWNDFLKVGKVNPCQPCPPQANDICTIMYTSGTSGQPKGVMLTHESHAMYVKGVDLFMDQFDDKMTTNDVFLSFLPLAHILDRMIEEYFFHKGASIGYYHGDLNALRDDIQELKPTLLVGVPRVYERIYEGILKAIAELRPLRRVIFNALYNRKLASMKAGYSHKTASPFADMLAFRKVKARLGGRLRLLISGGAPLSSEIEEFLRVTTCEYTRVIADYEAREEARKKYLKEQQLKKLEEKDTENDGEKDGENAGSEDDEEDGLRIDEAKVDESAQMDFAKVEKRVRTTGGGSTGTVRNLRIREDTAKYLLNLDVNSAYYDPKTRSMREDPMPDADPNDKFYVGDNQNRLSGQALEFKQLNIHAWEAFDKGQDIHMQAAPSQAELLYKSFKIKKEMLKSEHKDKIMEKYGNAASEDTIPRELLLGQSEREIEYDRTGRIIKGQDVSLPKSKYEEDIFINNHTTVWGSWWKDHQWGYKCCKQTIKNSYCTGLAGIEAAEASADLMKANMARKEAAEDVPVQHEEKRLATWGTDVPQDLVLDKKLLEESLKKENARRKEEKDERKRKYNVKWNDEVTAEDMEAYRMKKIHHDDPMRDFL